MWFKFVVSFFLGQKEGADRKLLWEHPTYLKRTAVELIFSSSRALANYIAATAIYTTLAAQLMAEHHAR
jgi:hypothetical protein